MQIWSIHETRYVFMFPLKLYLLICHKQGIVISSRGKQLIKKHFSFTFENMFPNEVMS